MGSGESGLRRFVNPEGIIPSSFPSESGTLSRCEIAGKQAGVAAAAVGSVKRQRLLPRHPLTDKQAATPPPQFNCGPALTWH